MQEWLSRLTNALAGTFRLERELGAGGMATVYLAQDVRHQRAVAIKVLRPDVALALGRERFQREIAIAAPLAHPNIVAVLDSGEADGMLYYVMPYVPGESLRARMQREGELPIADALRIVRGLLRALTYAHAHGVVHRDLKPENVLLAGDEPLLADFGIARPSAPSPDETRLTSTGMAVGTTAYMSPEQAAGDPRVDHRTDLYALGMLWYEMLAGAHPFAALSPQQQVAAHFTHAIEPVHAVRPSVPESVAAMLARCLEKRPADRWQDATELLRQLDTFLAKGTGDSWREGAPVPMMRAFRLDEEVLVRMTDGFDPRMPGDAIRYLDNGRISDTLICYLPRWGIDATDGVDVLQQTPFRAISPELFGFDPDRRYRIALPIDDHLVLLGALLESVATTSGATRIVVVGFSTGADLVMRLAAAPRERVAARIDGVLAIGGNLATETAFLSSVLAQLGNAREDGLLPFLLRVTGRQEQLQDWLDVNEYLVRLVRRFRADPAILRNFAHGIASPFAEEGALVPFVRWYRALAERGSRIRCVFEDNATYRGLVRQLQPTGTGSPFGASYQPGSLTIEPGAGHFDLERPEIVLRHLDQFVQLLRGA
ncbi:MAG: protein kinase [Gemmatimonadaceae bacterium]|nr:protein kinase [Gemmatimonadaceae bacterium]